MGSSLFFREVRWICPGFVDFMGCSLDYRFNDFDSFVCSRELFMTKYREYDARYQELQAKVDTLEAEKRNRQGRIKRFEVFIQALKKQQGELSDFDDDTWLAVIETVLVRPDGKLVFRFANGLEVEQ